MGIGIILNTILLIVSNSIHYYLTKLELVVFICMILVQVVIIYKLYYIAKEMLLAVYDR